MPTKDARRTTIHEAAHAVMVFYLGNQPITEVLLAYAGEQTYGDGVCRRGDSRSTDTTLQAARDILLHVAGRAAEAIFDGSESEHPFRSDLAKSMEPARMLTHSERDAWRLVVTQYQRAREILSEPAHWCAVVTLAEVLFWRCRLDGEAATRLIRVTIERSRAAQTRDPAGRV